MWCACVLGAKEVQPWEIDMHWQIVKLTRQLVEIDNSKDHDESNHKFIAVLRIRFKGVSRWGNLLIQMNMLLKLIFLMILVFWLLESTMYYVLFWG